MFIKIALGAFLLFFTAPLPSEIPTNSVVLDDHSFFVGTYTRGESKGIYRYVLRADGTLENQGLAAEDNNPSFLAKSKDNKFLLSVNEIRNDSGGGGIVKSYAIDGDKNLSLIDSKSSGGASPCFVSIDASGNVLTANYSSGNVGLLKLSANGTLSGPSYVLQHTGKGTHPRQAEPHAHSAWFEPIGNSIVTVDLGTNELWFSNLDNNNQKLVPKNPQKLAMNPGDGPRHLTFHPNGHWAYVINELSSTVTQIKKNTSGNYEIVHTVSTLPEGFEERNSCADIHISADGKFLYASNRGHNSIAIYSVNESNGNIQLIGHESSRGEAPRNFSLSPDGSFVLVANQNSNNIVSFKRDAEAGTMTFVDEITAPSPVCILF